MRCSAHSGERSSGMHVACGMHLLPEEELCAHARGLQKTLELSFVTAAAAAQPSPLGDHDMVNLLRTSVDAVHAAQDECRGWDVNEIVFGPAMWPTYHSLMRADFTLFDEYQYHHAGRIASHMPNCLV